jgi:hypothetical protein
MDSLSDLLGRKDLPSGDDVAAIKSYIADTYATQCGVEHRGNSIIISVPSAALAQTLRMELHTIRQRYNIEKRLAIRIGR